MGPMCYAAKQRALFVAPSLLEMTESNHELPGVKGQWIKVGDCPPPETRTCERRKELKGAESTEYWRPTFCDDNRPFTLPATSISSEPVSSRPKLAAGQVWLDRGGRKCTISKNHILGTSYPFESDLGKGGYCALTADGISCLGEENSGTLVELISEQSVSPESVERKIEELGTTDSGTILAKGDDETLWYLCERPDSAEVAAKFFWVQIPPLPTREA